MTHQAFDSFVRGAVITRDRRSALAILTGAILATACAPRGTLATLGGDEPKKVKTECDDKKQKKKAKQRAKKCDINTSALCLTHLDLATAAACAVEFEACCAFVSACLIKEARQCANKLQVKYGIKH